jgi:hypothetical protein
MSEANQILFKIDKLIDSWCERRSLGPLRHILRSYPPLSGLTDEWGAVLDSLKDIKGLCGGELTDDEKKTMTELINAVHKLVYR